MVLKEKAARKNSKNVNKDKDTYKDKDNLIDQLLNNKVNYIILVIKY